MESYSSLLADDLFLSCTSLLYVRTFFQVLGTEQWTQHNLQGPYSHGTYNLGGEEDKQVNRKQGSKTD